MAWKWKIQRAAVEQEILFPTREIYDTYIDKLVHSQETFEIIKEEDNEDGSMSVVMRKRYNNNPFMHSEKENN